MATLGQLIISLKANIAKFESDMGKAAYIADQNSKKIAAAINSAQATIVRLGVAAAGVMGFHKLWSDMKTLGDEAKVLEKTAQRLGMSIESLSSLEYVAKKNKIDVETFTNGLMFMQKNI